MEPTSIPTPENTEETPKNKVVLFVGVGVLFLIFAAIIFYVVVFGGGGNVGEKVRSILPFGIADYVNVDQNTNNNDKLGDVGIPGGEAGLSRMWKIADGPVSGAVFKTLPNGSLAVRYVLREDGDVYEYTVESRAGRILANNTIPRVQEAVWDMRGQSVVLRTATDKGGIVSVLGKLLPNPSTGAGDEAPAILEQSFLPENIAFISAHPTEGFVHTLRVGNELSIMRLDGNAVSSPVFTSPFSEWIPEWFGPEHIGLTTRPSGLVGGYFFSLDPQNGLTTPVLGDLPGLTTKSAPDGSAVLVGQTNKSTMGLGILTKGSGIPNTIVPATLPEKCAWAPSNTLVFCGVPESPPRAVYPDEWYQGLVRFSDTLWQYSLESGQFSLFLIPHDVVGVDVDITQPMVSADGAYLVFINKKDGSLWGVKL